MRRRWIVSTAIFATLATSCAGPRASSGAASSQPMAQFFEPRPGQCAPAIDGVCLLWPGVDALLAEQARRETAWKVALINADERAEVAEAQQASADRERQRMAATQAFWSTWGWPMVLGGLVIGGIAGAATAGSLLRR